MCKQLFRYVVKDRLARHKRLCFRLYWKLFSEYSESQHAFWLDKRVMKTLCSEFKELWNIGSNCLCNHAFCLTPSRNREILSISNKQVNNADSSFYIEINVDISLIMFTFQWILHYTDDALSLFWFQFGHAL